ncbi:ATP-binding cassette domain-containing protein [Methanothrix sp.]|uniref:ATP-binding cassette domain-containing protein n=1 Tax=Methanothrix sp. TaxID=90426 RepID=UPI00308117AF
MMIKLQAKDMDFGYNSSKILQNVNFEIAPSKLVTIVGPNGSGKSLPLRGEASSSTGRM